MFTPSPWHARRMRTTSTANHRSIIPRLRHRYNKPYYIYGLRTGVAFRDRSSTGRREKTFIAAIRYWFIWRLFKQRWYALDLYGIRSRTKKSHLFKIFHRKRWLNSSCQWTRVGEYGVHTPALLRWPVEWEKNCGCGKAVCTNKWS